jgi:hypothetical protein
MNIVPAALHVRSRVARRMVGKPECQGWLLSNRYKSCRGTRPISPFFHFLLNCACFADNEQKRVWSLPVSSTAWHMSSNGGGLTNWPINWGKNRGWSSGLPGKPFRPVPHSVRNVLSAGWNFFAIWPFEDRHDLLTSSFSTLHPCGVNQSRALWTRIFILSPVPRP